MGVVRRGFCVGRWSEVSATALPSVLTTLTTLSLVLTTCPRPLVINLIPILRPVFSSLSALTGSITSFFIHFCFSVHRLHSAPTLPLSDIFFSNSSARWRSSSSFFNRAAFCSCSRFCRSTCSFARRSASTLRV